MAWSEEQKKLLWDAYEDEREAVDSLPYTSSFESFFQRLSPLGFTRDEVWRQTINMRRMDQLPKKPDSRGVRARYKRWSQAHTDALVEIGLHHSRAVNTGIDNLAYTNTFLQIYIELILRFPEVSFSIYNVWRKALNLRKDSRILLKDKEFCDDDQGELFSGGTQEE